MSFNSDDFPICEVCCFKSDNPEYCNFGGNLVRKEGFVEKIPLKSLFDCYFSLRQSHLDRMPKEKAEEKRTEIIQKVSKYLIK